MPCTVHITEADRRVARRHKELCQLIKDVQDMEKERNVETSIISDDIRIIVDECGGPRHTEDHAYVDLDLLTRALCKTIRSLTPHGEEFYLYSARIPASRRLATWWEEHEEEDKKREYGEDAALPADIARRVSNIKETRKDAKQRDAEFEARVAAREAAKQAYDETYTETLQKLEGEG